MMKDNTFGKLLEKRIEDAGTSRTALGRTVGVHRTTISDYINGKNLPKEETFHRIHQVFPDKELYDAYFNAVKATEPRRNKQIIPGAEPYNWYKAITEKVDTNKAKRNESDEDRKYIALALHFLINDLIEKKMDIFAPNDYAKYVELYNKYSGKE